MITHRIVRLMIAGLIGLALGPVVHAAALPETLVKEGLVVDHDYCIHEGERSYCVLMVHKGEPFIAIGIVQDDIFYVQRVLAVKGDKTIQVWSFNEVST